MPRNICIHGHFYQPPREDPWYGRIFSECTAAPARHWNARITRESYKPLALARRMDGDGNIIEILNCYEWMSFNFGPTLLAWMEREEQDLLKLIIEADKKSVARCGYGNAMAQIYHHVIMPLATKKDKEIEVVWALDMFKRIFGRDAEGIWLSECASDIETLEVLVDHNIKFVTLSPFQAKAIVDTNGKQYDVSSGRVSIGQPYKIDLPSGRNIAVFFYHGSLAQDVAFNGLLRNGDDFWNHLLGATCSTPDQGYQSIMTLSTDGETYGHHFMFGEMALAHVLSKAREGCDDIRITNFASYLSKNKPTRSVILHNPSSWSCAHGVERWRADCGCKDGGHSDWNQKWREPLRKALDLVSTRVDEHLAARGVEVFSDIDLALLNFGKVITNPNYTNEFEKKHFLKGCNTELAWKLLRMKESALASYASCAWFFDDISRIEPVKSMSFALRAIELLIETGADDISETFKSILRAAISNKNEEGSGEDILMNHVLLARQDVASIVLFAYMHAFSSNYFDSGVKDISMSYPYMTVQLTQLQVKNGCCSSGKASIQFSTTSNKIEEFSWSGALPLDMQGTNSKYLGASDIFVEVKEKTKHHVRKLDELSKHLQDFLVFNELESSVDKHLYEMLSITSNLLRQLHNREEGQAEDIGSANWSRFASYIPAAIILSDRLSFESLTNAKNIFNTTTTSFGASIAKRTVCKIVKDIMLNTKIDDEVLSARLSQMSRVLVDMDWWEIQNLLWSDKELFNKYTKSRLNFRMR